MGYQFDNLDRRYEADLVDGTKWNYGYDDRSQVTSGKRQLASGAYAGGEQFEYGFDDIGNRTVARFGGDGAGANLRESGYAAANSDNQLTSRSVPGSAWVVGDAPTNLVLQGAAQGRSFTIQRQDSQRFFGETTLSNNQGAVYARITVAGKTNTVMNDLESGREFVAQNPESFIYDNDGNLIQDGRWAYTWDAENRLISVTARTDIPDAAKRRADFLYDTIGRRVQKIVSAWSGSQYTSQTTNVFVYDGWNLVAILDGHGGLIQSFNWGLDLSGTTQGAGGVGGLLAETVNVGATAGAYYYSFDGNGNVQTLANAADGSLAANYEYGPFGEVIRATGPMAKVNPFRFSTKYQDDETDTVYYGYRYYNANQGTWLARDPLGERGGLNLCSFVKNGPVSRVDILGLDLSDSPPRGGTPATGDPGRWDVPYDQFEEYIQDAITGRHLLPGERKVLEWGCVGQCSVLQRFFTEAPNLQPFPEQAKNTKCFKTQAEAQASKCANGKQSFIFAKQGRRWQDGSKDGPKGYDSESGQPNVPGNEKGEIPIDSVWPDAKSGNGVFNYIAMCRVKGKDGKEYTVYTWMNHAKKYGDSAGRVSDHPYRGDSTYKVTMWCRTCPE